MCDRLQRINAVLASCVLPEGMSYMKTANPEAPFVQKLISIIPEDRNPEAKYHSFLEIQAPSNMNSKHFAYGFSIPAEASDEEIRNLVRDSVEQFEKEMREDTIACP